jgi:hypothetical protein
MLDDDLARRIEVRRFLNNVNNVNPVITPSHKHGTLLTTVVALNTYSQAYRMVASGTA